MSILTWEFLKEIGFKDTPAEFGTYPHLRFVAGGLYISASISRSWDETIDFGGSFASKNGRTLKYIDFSLGLELESKEQGYAFLAYYIEPKRRSVEFFKDGFPYNWLEEGWKNSRLLPWKKEMALYDLRPHCSIDREMAKILRKQLREIMKIGENVEIIFAFDGEVLSVKSRDLFFACAGRGKKWTSRIAIIFNPQWEMPKKFTTERVLIDAYDGHLGIGHYIYSGIKFID